MIGSGNGGCEGRGSRGRFGKLIPLVSASMIISRAVMTQSTSRTGCGGGSSEDADRQ